MYHNGWRENQSDANSSPLVPNLYVNHYPDPNVHHSTDQIPQVYHHQHHPSHSLPQQNQYSHITHQPPPLFQHHSAPQVDFTSTLAQLAAGQRELFETMNSLNVKIDSVQRQPAPSVEQLTSGLNNINLDQQAPPHHMPQQFPHQPQTYPARAPQPSQNVQPSRVSSPSEGHYARDTNRLIFREPKVR